MPPPLCATIPYTVESPRPVPIPSCLVVKNGSKMCGSTLVGDPGPVVGDRQRDVAARRERRRDAFLGCRSASVSPIDSVITPAVAQRVAGVEGEIDDHALDLRGVGDDRGDTFRELALRLRCSPGIVR